MTETNEILVLEEKHIVETLEVKVEREMLPIETDDDLYEFMDKYTDKSNGECIVVVGLDDDSIPIGVQVFPLVTQNEIKEIVTRIEKLEEKLTIKPSSYAIAIKQVGCFLPDPKVTFMKLNESLTFVFDNRNTPIEHFIATEEDEMDYTSI